MIEVRKIFVNHLAVCLAWQRDFSCRPPEWWAVVLTTLLPCSPLLSLFSSRISNKNCRKKYKAHTLHCKSVKIIYFYEQLQFEKLMCELSMIICAEYEAFLISFIKEHAWILCTSAGKTFRPISLFVFWHWLSGCKNIRPNKKLKSEWVTCLGKKLRVDHLPPLPR